MRLQIHAKGQPTYACSRSRRSIPNEHQHRQHKDGNLDGRAKSHTNGQIHLVLVGDQDSSDVLTGIASNGQDDETQKGFTQTRLLTDVTDGVCKKPAIACTFKAIPVVDAVSSTRSTAAEIRCCADND